MIELKRLKLINWHNFENTTFDCARLTYMIGVNAVGKTTILDAIRYCLTTNRNFNALGNKKSGRTLQGSVHAKQRGENAYRRPGHTVAYIGAEFWDSVKHTSFVIAVRVESEGPMQECQDGGAVFAPAHRNPYPVSCMNEMVLTDGFFNLRLEIRDKMIHTEMQAGVWLEKDGLLPAPVAPHRIPADQTFIPACHKRW